MPRVTRLFVSVLLPIAFWSSFVPRPPHSPGYIRVILVHGELVKTPIIITEEEGATALYNSMVGAFRFGERYPESKLEGRPCIGIAAFLPGGKTKYVPISELRPEQAEFQYWFYPTISDEPPVVIASRLMPKSLEEQLGWYGVPLRAQPGAEPCKWVNGAH